MESLAGHAISSFLGCGTMAMSLRKLPPDHTPTRKFQNFAFPAPHFHTLFPLWTPFRPKHKTGLPYLLPVPLWCNSRSRPFTPMHGESNPIRPKSSILWPSLNAWRRQTIELLAMCLLGGIGDGHRSVRGSGEHIGDSSPLRAIHRRTRLDGVGLGRAGGKEERDAAVGSPVDAADAEKA